NLRHICRARRYHFGYAHTAGPGGTSEKLLRWQHIRNQPLRCNRLATKEKAVFARVLRKKTHLQRAVPPSLPASYGVLPTQAWEFSQAPCAGKRRLWTTVGIASSTRICSPVAAGNCSARVTRNCRCRQSSCLTALPKSMKKAAITVKE